MTDTPLDTLYDHHARALDLLTRGHDLLEGDKATALAKLPAIRAEMAAVLRAYQVFKHETIFDPAVATGEPECMKLGRAMKIECIAAGEAFRVHGQQWKTEAMAADWPNYRVAARLTLHALRRHLERERAGIERLIAMLQSGLQSGGRCASQ